jgi:predicted RNA methylase
MDQEKLTQLFRQLINLENSEKKNIQLLKNVKVILHKNSEYSGNHTYDNIPLNQGIAVNCKLASDCFDDYLRTYSFMLAVFQCISQKTKQDSKKVRILYAGTGPFLSIILPSIFLFSSDQISITTLEINETSYNYSKKLILNFGKTDYFEANLYQNALTFDTNQKFDIIISETMDKALTREPQIAIFSNLVKLLKPDGNLIPQSIKIHLVASSIKLEKNVDFYCCTDKKTRELNNEHRQFIKTIMEANRQFYETAKLIESESLYLTTISTSQIKTELNELLLLTEVQLNEDLILKEDDSWLTKKYICHSFSNATRGKDFNIYYINNESPIISLKVKD